MESIAQAGPSIMASRYVGSASASRLSPFSVTPILRLTCAIATDEIARENLPRRSGVEIVRGRQHAICALFEVGYRRAAENPQALHRRRVREHDRFEVNLIDAVGRLRRRPPAIGTVFFGIAFRAAWNGNAADFYSGCRRPEGNVVGKVGRKAGIAHGGDEAKPGEKSP